MKLTKFFPCTDFWLPGVKVKAALTLRRFFSGDAAALFVYKTGLNFIIITG